MIRKHMMATVAIHALGDISRTKPDIALIQDEDNDCWVGEWVSGLGFINVLFPKATTHELTEEQREYYRACRVYRNGILIPIVIEGE